MKVLKVSRLLLLLFFLHCVDLRTNKENFESLSIAFKNITNTLFELNGEVLIIKYELNGRNAESAILKSLAEENIPFRATNIKRNRFVISGREKIAKTYEKIYHFNNSIIALNSFANLSFYQTSRLLIEHGRSSTSDKLSGLDIFKWRNFLTYVHAFDSGLDFIKKKPVFRLHIKNYYFIVEEEEFIKLKTFVWFLPGKCTELNLIEINSFSKKENVWKNSHFTIKKFTNFHGCNIPIEGTSQRFTSDVLTLYGLLDGLLPVEKFAALEKLLNTTLSVWKKVVNVLEVDLNFAHVSGFESFDEYERNKDFRVNFNLVDQIDAKDSLILYSHPLAYRSIYFSIPVGIKYTGFEKLILPFDDDVWILILLTFFCAFCTIFFSRFLKVKIRNFIIGQYIHTLTLNVCMIVVGISQNTLPGRNFARFLTMVFILYCLIMRTAWQGKMFEFLQKDMRKPEVKSIEEMIEKNFTFYMDNEARDFLEKTDFGERFVNPVLLGHQLHLLSIFLPQSPHR